MKAQAKPAQQDKRDYLALIYLNGECGSWARGDNKIEVAQRAARILKQDWKHLYKLPKGKIINVAVADVTGHNTIEWRNGGSVVIADGKKIEVEWENLEVKL